MLYVAGQMSQTPWGPLAERYQHGKRLRKKVPRERHAELLGSGDRDPVAILAAGDRTRVPELVPVRYERMLASPFAFLRGAAAVMAEDLRHQTTAGFPNKRARAAAAATSEAYRTRIRALAKLSPLEIWHSRIELVREIKRIEDRALRKKLHAILTKAGKRLEQDDNFPHLVQGKQPRIADEPPLIYHFNRKRDIRHRVDAEYIFASYQKRLPPEHLCLFQRYTLKDTAFKAVGVGSVGTFCAIGLFTSADSAPLFLQV